MITITSPAFKNNQSIPDRFTCSGMNISPPLDIENIPQGTQSLALIIDDPDAPGGTWDHWVVWNISPKITSINEGSLPLNSDIGTNSYNKTEYSGPCPPSGTHHYHFKIFALDTVLDFSLPGNSNDLRQAMTGHILDQNETVGISTQK